MNATFELGGRSVGEGHPCLIVAEIAQAHDGSLGTAHAYIDAAAEAGADAVKFQTHIARAESTPAEPWRVRFSPQDESRYDYWARMEFSEAQWRGLKAHAAERGLLFMSSPFSVEAVDLLERVGVPAWKIASGETSNPQLLERVARTGLPVLVSSGMSSFAELDAAIGTLRAGGAPVAIYQCTSAYPCPAEQTGLRRIEALRQRYGCPVGLSDHSGTIWAGLAAVALGANLLEVHVIFHRRMFGPDVPASLTIEELAQLVEGTRFIERALHSTPDKDETAEEMSTMRSIFGKSIVARHDLEAGTVLREADITVKKPGTGIPAARWREIIGRRLVCDVVADQQIAEEALEGPRLTA